MYKAAHYAAVVNEVVAVKLRMPMGDRRNFKGKLISCDDDNIVVEVDNEVFTLAILNIEKGNVVPTFD